MLSDNDKYDLINELFSKYSQMMYRKAFSILHNKSDAEDAVQNTFLWIVDNPEKVPEKNSYEMIGYLAAITAHRSIDICRKRRRHPTDDIDEQPDLCTDENIEEEILSSMNVEEIRKALNELSDTDYRMLYLNLFKHKKTKEISAMMGIAENNIRTYLKRARERFIKILRERGIDYDI